jgi:hypothetical protein
VACDKGVPGDFPQGGNKGLTQFHRGSSKRIIERHSQNPVGFGTGFFNNPAGCLTGLAIFRVLPFLKIFARKPRFPDKANHQKRGKISRIFPAYPPEELFSSRYGCSTG